MTEPHPTKDLEIQDPWPRHVGGLQHTEFVGILIICHHTNLSNYKDPSIIVIDSKLSPNTRSPHAVTFSLRQKLHSQKQRILNTHHVINVKDPTVKHDTATST